jgi:hypothetical protein
VENTREREGSRGGAEDAETSFLGTFRKSFLATAGTTRMFHVEHRKMRGDAEARRVRSPSGRGRRSLFGRRIWRSAHTAKRRAWFAAGDGPIPAHAAARRMRRSAFHGPKPEKAVLAARQGTPPVCSTWNTENAGHAEARGMRRSPFPRARRPQKRFLTWETPENPKVHAAARRMGRPSGQVAVLALMANRVGRARGVAGRRQP